MRLVFGVDRFCWCFVGELVLLLTLGDMLRLESDIWDDFDFRLVAWFLRPGLGEGVVGCWPALGGFSFDLTGVGETLSELTRERSPASSPGGGDFTGVVEIGLFSVLGNVMPGEFEIEFEFAFMIGLELVRRLATPVGIELDNRLFAFALFETSVAFGLRTLFRFLLDAIDMSISIDSKSSSSSSSPFASEIDEVEMDEVDMKLEGRIAEIRFGLFLLLLLGLPLGATEPVLESFKLIVRVSRICVAPLPAGGGDGARTVSDCSDCAVSDAPLADTVLECVPVDGGRILLLGSAPDLDSALIVLIVRALVTRIEATLGAAADLTLPTVLSARDMRLDAVVVDGAWRDVIPTTSTQANQDKNRKTRRKMRENERKTRKIMSG